ncbi:RING1 and YY1-binding protein [Rhinatrema bivittatum]|uniref:RING1 and YY1-binding protein n=1 Tax=Rhinatrema bivittatum TaxID=194408 RepID=UPI00112BBE81|nr:RING1 and YY1-binding protein [Rhinatrema bivittatum]
MTMGDKKSPTRPKRQAKPAADEGFWDCSVCTFRNSAEAFKCSICDVRKGTSTRKPRINSQLVAQQVAQQYATPPPPKKEKKEKVEKPEKEKQDKEKLDKEKPEREKTEKEKPERERTDKEKPERERTDKEKPERERTDKEKPERERTDKEKPEREKLEKEKPEREKFEKEKPEREKLEKEKLDKEISTTVVKKITNKKTRPKSDIMKDAPSEVNSIQSGNTTAKINSLNHTSRPRLKNVDRSTAQQLAVTVGNVTVIITDFKEKTRSSSTSSSTVTSSAGSEQQNQSSSGSECTDKGSSRSSTPKGDMSAVNDESF